MAAACVAELTVAAEMDEVHQAVAIMAVASREVVQLEVQMVFVVLTVV